MKITDNKLKKFMGFLLRNKQDLLVLTDYFQAEDIERGVLKINEAFVNIGIKEKIMGISEVQDYLKDYTIYFQSGCIMLDLNIQLKHLGPISAKYMISIKSFNFSETEKRIYCSFKEDVNSLGNMIQAMALKSACISTTFLQTAAKVTNLNFLSVDGHNLMIDLESFSVAEKLSEYLKLDYIDSSEGELKFAFQYLG